MIAVVTIVAWLVWRKAYRAAMAGGINKVVAHKPAGMTLAMHLCRGNFKSTHAAAGNYEPVAEALLSEMNLDAFFLDLQDEMITGKLIERSFCRKAGAGCIGIQHDTATRVDQRPANPCQRCAARLVFAVRGDKLQSALRARGDP